jgi:hypothetical protein
MTISVTWRLSVAGLVLVLWACERPVDNKEHELFAKAIENESTAPNYVLIRVINDKTKEMVITCTEAPFLIGAIHMERQIPYDEPGSRKAKELALTRKDRTFRFSRDDALKNIGRHYDETILAEMRVALKPFSDVDIRNGFRGDGRALDKLYIDRPGRQYSAYRDAIAHVLLERGLLPRRGCIAGILTIDE